MPSSTSCRVQDAKTSNYRREDDQRAPAYPAASTSFQGAGVEDVKDAKDAEDVGRESDEKGQS